MLDSILLGVSLFCLSVLVIMFNMADKRLKKLSSPDEITILHIKHHVLLKNRKFPAPIFINHYAQAIELLEDEALQNKLKDELNIQLKNLKPGETFFKINDYTITLQRPNIKQ